LFFFCFCCIKLFEVLSIPAERFMRHAIHTLTLYLGYFHVISSDFISTNIIPNNNNNNNNNNNKTRSNLPRVLRTRAPLTDDIDHTAFFSLSCTSLRASQFDDSTQYEDPQQACTGTVQIVVLFYGRIEPCSMARPVQSRCYLYTLGPYPNNRPTRFRRTVHSLSGLVPSGTVGTIMRPHSAHWVI
jgi:hypothetical protein